MIINQDWTLVIKMNPGLTAADVLVKVKAPSAIVFSTVPYISIEDFVASEGDYYNIKIPKSFITEVGDYVFSVTNPFVVIELTEEALPYYGPTASDLCVIYGNVRDIGGTMPSYQNVQLVVYPVKLPEVVGSTFTLGQRLTISVDYTGSFSIPLLIGSTAVFEIKDAGMRIQAVIPDAPTASLASLIPPPVRGVIVK